MSIENECGNKLRYASKAEAKRAEKIIRTVSGGSRQHAYRCPYCDRWHTGHGRGRADPEWVERDNALRYRASQIETMIRQERDALNTAQTPTQRRFYEKRIADMQLELLDTWGAINSEVMQCS